MKIERIEIYPLVAELNEPFGWSQRWTSTRATTAVKIIANDGTYGWGESGAAETMRSLAPLLIGEDATLPERAWQKIYAEIYQGHNYSGPGMNALSAFDMALWDIAGKVAGRPVSEMLGGGSRDRVPVYATGLYYLENDYPNRMAEEARGYVDAGFTGVKMKVGGKGFLDDVNRVYHVRDVIGEDIHLMFDANEGYDVKTAIDFGRRVADADISWFEEPCGSYDLDANIQVRNNVPMPTSGGESRQTRYEFSDLFAKHVFDIVQPDIVNVGGISEMFKVGHMANAYGVQFNPHFWGSGISLAATLHVAACLPSNPPSFTAEPYVNQTVMEFDRTPHPIRENLTEPIFDQVDSHIAVPTSPGLGIEVHDDVLKKYLQGDGPIVVDQAATTAWGR
ncbi:MAG TPA: mandelate racemase/muconate lactonizing enzyme family protein [Dehalococcoidia bacterium]|nr:mandelate racemase/muconate lactonizing enzyme family protein [Dehalococcoidia bacterium]